MVQSRFSTRTKVYKNGGAIEFVNKLHEGWSERHPGGEAAGGEPADNGASRSAPIEPGAVFLSYASEDREAARKLKEAFEAAGLSVVGSVAGLYLWVEVGDDLSTTQRLIERQVIVSPGRAFGTGGEGYIRLAMVPTVGECEEAAKVVTECLKS